jgi:hypothetical protein
MYKSYSTELNDDLEWWTEKKAVTVCFKVIFQYFPRGRVKNCQSQSRHLTSRLRIKSGLPEYKPGVITIASWWLVLPYRHLAYQHWFKILNANTSILATQLPYDCRTKGSCTTNYKSETNYHGTGNKQPTNFLIQGLVGAVNVHSNGYKIARRYVIPYSLLLLQKGHQNMHYL